MPNNFPHDFPCIRSIDEKTVLFCGAGLSVGMVPIVGKFFDEIREKSEKKLGISELECSSEWKAENWEERLYCWAECVLEWLSKQGESNPKLKLANALGITTDSHWWGESGVDFRGNTDRHRVIARLAKEGCWQSVWSFNWDCIMEKAMESVGVLSEKPKHKTPWKIDHYCTHITNDDLSASHIATALAVRKPHGCVTALKKAKLFESIDPQKSIELSERFMISKSELKDRSYNTVDDAFFTRLKSDVSGHVSVAVGWRIAEESLCKKLISAMDGVPDTQINIVDINFDDDTHGKVCNASGQNRASAFFEVSKDDCPVTNDLFRWIHALYTLDRLCEHDGEATDVTGKLWRNSVSVCNKSSFFIDWADEFLPTWTRLCWSAELIQCHGFKSHEIDVERRDEHIPLNIENISRPDLTSAKRILADISISEDLWDSRTFPGGLYDSSKQLLVIPLPVWSRFNELRALKPMLNAIRQSLWMVSEIKIYPVTVDEEPYDATVLDDLLFHLAGFINIPAFALPGRIHVMNKLNLGEP